MGQHEITLAEQIRRRFPNMPIRLEWKLARRYHAQPIHRVFEGMDIPLTVVLTHVRHTLSDYDRLLASGYTKEQAREAVRRDVYRTMDLWGK